MTDMEPRTKWTSLPLVLLVAVGCTPGDHGTSDVPTLGDPAPLCATLGLETPLPLPLDTVAAELEVPWDLTFLPDGRILLTERTGTVRLIDGDGLRPEPWATLAVSAVAEAGLLGLDAAPDFAETGHVFLAMTYEDIPDGRIRRVVAAVGRRIRRFLDPDAPPVWTNKIVRLTDTPAGGVDPVTVVDGVPSGPVHAGGALRFGPAGHLHLSTGDGGVPERAARKSSLGGKILRFAPDGSPIGSDGSVSPVLAHGFRNPQGLAWLPGSETLVAIDHGPTGHARELHRRHQDELTRVVPGADHGWPAVAGMREQAGSVLPLVEWTPALAPAGLAIVDSPESPWHQSAFVTGLRGTQLRRVVLEHTGGGEGLRAVCEEVLLALDHGRLRAVRTGPDGYLYVATSNRDQRGSPGPADDLLLRIPIPGSANARGGFP